jgi:hypothetical protein
LHEVEKYLHTVVVRKFPRFMNENVTIHQDL